MIFANEFLYHCLVLQRDAGLHGQTDPPATGPALPPSCRNEGWAANGSSPPWAWRLPGTTGVTGGSEDGATPLADVLPPLCISNRGLWKGQLWAPPLQTPCLGSSDQEFSQDLITLFQLVMQSNLSHTVILLLYRDVDVQVGGSFISRIWIS